MSGVRWRTDVLDDPIPEVRGFAARAWSSRERHPTRVPDDAQDGQRRAAGSVRAGRSSGRSWSRTYVISRDMADRPDASRKDVPSTENDSAESFRAAVEACLCQGACRGWCLLAFGDARDMTGWWA
jgi:hypothetical protein